MNKFVLGFLIGFLVGGMFIAYAAGRDWEEKVNKKSFTWRGITYRVIEVE